MTTTAAALEPKVRYRKRRRTPALIVKYVALAFAAIVVLMPVYVLLVASFKTGSDADPSRAWALPQVWSLDAWREAWNGDQYGLFPYLKNSLKLVIPATLISTMLGSLNGFVLSRWRFPGSDVVFLFLLFGMFIPYQAVMIPLTQIFVDVDFPDGLPRLIFAHIVYGIPITTLIFRSYYATIPEDLIEAARMDRAGMLRTYWSVVLPISRSGLRRHRDLAVHLDLERLSLRHLHRRGSRPMAGDRRAQQHDRLARDAVQRPDGRGAHSLAADAGRLHPARPLLHARPHGRSLERMSADG